MNLFWLYSSTIIVNLLDIFIVWYIFYRVLILIRHTRAVQIMMGIVILLVVTVISTKVLPLVTVSWLLDKFWIAAMVILVVVFQPEIRSALAQLGSHPWSGILLPSELDFINELVEAVRECGENQVGALIAIEQNVGLKPYIETGIVLNAHISKELLLSIFNPKSPMHDGSVIIHNTRLVAARCILPLSNEPIVSKTLGTRHRAAIGLSEVSDAVIIIVSNETGRVSIARKGRLEGDIDPEQLRHRLLTLYRQKGEQA